MPLHGAEAFLMADIKRKAPTEIFIGKKCQFCVFGTDFVLYILSLIYILRMNNQFSQLISVVLSHSREAASRLRNKSIYPDHLMLGILADENNRVIRILQKLHIDIQFLKQNIEEALKETEINKEEESIEVSLSASSSKILKMRIQTILP